MDNTTCILGAGGFIGKSLIKQIYNFGEIALAFDRKKHTEVLPVECLAFSVNSPKEFYRILRMQYTDKERFPAHLICAIGDNKVHKHSFNMNGQEFAQQIHDNLVVVFEYITSYAKLCAEINFTGNIVLLSSVGAQKSHREMCGYDSAKGGIEALCRSLSLDFAPYNITINALEIGPIDDSPSSLQDGESSADLKALIPAGHYPTVIEIAKYILSFTWSVPWFLTGQILALDGGLTIQLRPMHIERLCDFQMYKGGK